MPPVTSFELITDIVCRSVGVSAPLTREPGSRIQRARGLARRGRPALPLVLLLVTSGCGLVGHELRHLAGSPAQRLADDVTIERDAHGVPRVHGRSDAATLFGLAYAMAEDNYWQVEEDMLLALGWAAHYHGESRVAHDSVRGAFDVERRARAEYAAEPAERRALWDAFAHGLNHYLHTHPEAPRRLLARYEPWMLFARAAFFDARTLADTLPPPGGWGWAVPPPQSATGEALLVATLDGPYFGTGQLYEAAVHSDAGWHAAGAFQLGLPLLRAGHNQAASWLTVRAPSPAARLERLRFDHPTDSLLFRTDGEWQRAEVRDHTLDVNTPGGVVRRSVRFIDTPYGPVIRRQGDTAYAARLADFVQAGSLQHFWLLGRATSLDAFRAAQAAAHPGWNTLYADVEGRTAAWIDGVEHTGGPDAPLLLGAAPVPPPAAPGGGWTPGALEAVAFDATVPDAAGHIEALVDEWERIGGSNPRRAFVLDSAVAVLRGWDGRFDATSGPALLYAAWQEEYARAGGSAAGYGRFRALEAARERVAREYAGAATWGDLLRLQRRHTSGLQAFADTLPSLPLGAAPAGAGAGFTVASRRDLGWRRYAVEGRAWTAVIRLSRPPHARTVVPFGQSAHEGSAHFRDQAPRFAAGELKDLESSERPDASGRGRYHPGRRARVLQQ